MKPAIVETALGPVEYWDVGSGSPVLYFHGTGITGEPMLGVESPLVDDGFRLIVPNRPGYGRTPLAPHDSIAGSADVAAALLDALNVPVAGVMGSSGGGVFAAKFAMRHAARTSSLVLLCPQLHRWDDPSWLPAASRWTLPFLKRPRLRRLLLWLYRRQMPRMKPKQLLKMEVGPRYREFLDDPAALKLSEITIAGMAEGTRFDGFANDLNVFVEEELFDDGAEIVSPTLVLHDPTDPMNPVNHVEWFASKVPQCQCEPVDTAGHLVWIGREAEKMHAARVEFLREHAESDRH